MQHSNRWLIVVLIIAGLQLSACERKSGAHHTEHPAEVKHIEGTALSRVTLTEKAAQRIGLKSDKVRGQPVPHSASPRKVVPYSSLIYDPQGQTWIYTSPKPRTFIRHKVEVDYIEGDIAVLNEGPPTGTVVASVGVAELYGSEFGIGH
jgi:hypothetical protein